MPLYLHSPGDGDSQSHLPQYLARAGLTVWSLGGGLSVTEHEPETQIMPRLAVLASAAIFFASFAVAEAKPTINQPAPDFSGTTASGETLNLDDLEGQTVVLEWTNHQCPFVSKHYGAGNMQALQQEMTEQGIVWLQVISSAPGRQGFVEGPEALALNEARDALPSDIVLDPEGTIGRAYAARTTPHMYIIDPEGTLVYMGGIDSIASANPADISEATNYVREAMAALAAGESVPNSVTRAYGCTIKYAPGS